MLEKIHIKNNFKKNELNENCNSIIEKKYTKFQKWKIESLIEKYTQEFWNYKEQNKNNKIKLKLETKKIVYRDDNGVGYYGLSKTYNFTFELNLQEKGEKKRSIQKIFICDNHNKVIKPILNFYLKNNQKKVDLIHIDAHRDDAKFRYTYPKVLDRNNINIFYEKTRVSDYLDLLEKTNIINNIIRLTETKDFETFDYFKKNNDIIYLKKNKKVETFIKKRNNFNFENYILNLDIDIFGFDGQAVELELKIKKIIEIWRKAKYIVIATSPGFMNQKNAVFLIETLIKNIYLK